MTGPLKALAVVVVLGLALPVLAEVSDEDVDRARREVNELMARSETLGQQVQDAWARQFSLETEMADLTSSIEYTKGRITETRRQLEDMAAEIYMTSAGGAALQILFGDPDLGMTAGLEYLREVSGVNVDVVNQLKSFRDQLDRQTDRLGEASEEQKAVTADLETKATRLQADLTAAQARYDQVVAQQQAEEEARRQAEAQRQAEEEARRRAAEAASSSTTTTNAVSTTVGGEDQTTTTTPPPDPSADGTCPVAGAVSFTDTWGAPRSGGRTHQGVDMIAARNTPLAAIYPGTITRISTGNLSGLSLWLRAADGDEFFYAHLESYGDISVGMQVSQGYVVGYVGSSGNAPDYLPHLHFEWHPHGGAAVDPYPLVKSVCG